MIDLRAGFYLLHHGIINVANKFQRDVQTFHAGPASISRQSGRAFHVFGKLCADFCGISSAMKRRMLHQLAADKVQGLLRGPVAYAVTIAGESTLDHFRMAAIRQA